MPVYRGNITMRHPVLGGPALNTWHVRTAGAVDIIDTIQQAQDAITDFYFSINTIYAGGTQITADGEWVEVGTQTPTQVNATPSTLGVASGPDPLPPHLAIVAGWGTQLRTKRGYGRTFLGPLRASLLETNGTPSDSALTTIRNAQDALLLESDAVNDWAIGVYSRADGVLRDYTRRTVHDRFAVMRSRRP